MASGTATIILAENPIELFDTLKLLLQEKQAGNDSDIINGEHMAKVDGLLEYECLSTKQHNLLLPNCLN